MADRRVALALLGIGLLNATAVAQDTPLAREVADAERSFARSMVQRDHAAFTALLSEQATFFGGRGQVHRGKVAVAAAWKGYFDGAQAPFP